MSAPEPKTLPQAHDATSERAARFHSRKRCGEWSEGDQAELDGWLAESTTHRVAWLRIQSIAGHADQLAALNALEQKQAARDGGKFRLQRFVIPLLAAASIALVGIVGYPFVAALMQPTDRNFSTDIGGRTFVKFADGTEIELNTDTAMRFRMTSTERTVWLQKGEAWFRVAHNAANPFNVIVGKHRVTDLGTEFTIRREADDVDVSLLTGQAVLNTEGTPATWLRPGDDAMATPVSVSVTRKTPQEMDDELAWRRGMLVFRNAPLSDVVREFNRYNATKLVIADPAIADVRISVELKTDHYEDFLQLAQSMLKLRIDREGGEILISRMPAKTKRATHVDRR